MKKTSISLEKQKISEEELVKLATGTNRLAAVDGDVENGMVQAGQSLLPLRKIEPVAKIIEDIVAEANKCFKETAGLVL